MKSDLVLMLVVAFLLGMFFKQMMGSVCSTVEGNSGDSGDSANSEESANSWELCFEGLNDFDWDNTEMTNWLTDSKRERPTEDTLLSFCENYSEECAEQWAYRIKNKERAGRMLYDVKLDDDVGYMAGAIMTNIQLSNDLCPQHNSETQ